MTVHLPDELAPALRARAEQLLAETRPADTGTLPTTTREQRSGRGPCYVCGQRRGRMGGHHVVPGDDSSVVPVHPSCHRKLHRKAKAAQVVAG